MSSKIQAGSSMKEAELRALATCTVCGKGVGHTGLPLFWRVRIDRFGIDINAAKRQDGLGAFLGSSALASVMGPGEALASAVMDTVELALCEPCAINRGIPVAALVEGENRG